MALTKVVYLSDINNQKPCLYKQENGKIYVLMNNTTPWWNSRTEISNARLSENINWDKLLAKDNLPEWKSAVLHIRKQIFYNEILDEN